MDLQWIYNLYDHVVNHHFPILSIIQWLRCFSVLKDASWLAEAKIREHLQEPLPYFIEKSRPMHGTTRLHWKGMYFYFLKLGLGRCPVKRCGRPSRNMAPTIPMESQGLDPLGSITCGFLLFPSTHPLTIWQKMVVRWVVSDMFYCQSLFFNKWWHPVAEIWDGLKPPAVLSNFSTEQVLHCWPVSTGFGPCIWPQLGDSLGATGHQHSHQPT